MTSIKGKVTLIVFSAAAIIASLIIFIIIPSISEIQEISNRIYLERLGLEERYRKGQSLRESLAEYKKNKDKIHLLAKVYIQNGEELNYLNQLEKTAGENNIKLEKIFTDPKEAPEINNDFRTISLELKISSNFIDTINFLHQLELLDIYTNIDTINISKKETRAITAPAVQDIDNKIFGTLIGTAFWQKEKIITNDQETTNNLIIEEKENGEN